MNRLARSPSSPGRQGRTTARGGSAKRSPKADRYGRLAQLLAALEGFAEPADTVVHRFFRAGPGLGVKDRSFLAESAFAAIRRWDWIEARLGQAGFLPAGPSYARRRALMAAGLGIGFDRMVSELSEGERHWLRAALSPEGDSLQTVYAIPNWIWQDWQVQLGLPEAEALAQAMDRSAPLDLRVNTLKATAAEVIASLAQAGIRAQLTEALPEAVRVWGRPALQKAEAFAKGWCEVQDLGSQCLARLAGPGRGKTVVDFCAGAGGKTLALGSLMHNTGRLYALDRSATRLAKLKPRLARSGLSNVWPIAISGLRDERLKRLRAKADMVLVDAPCSGLGTLRRNPDLKWRQKPQDQASLIALQQEILDAAADLVAPGGRLVYATCSTQSTENEDQVAAFLGRSTEFSRLSASEILSRQGLSLPADWRAFGPNGEMRLWPHRTGTDGFFAVVLARARR
ncbi:MAG: RsmB/NOP family class I SAM-dependent RNA methyltransferase [Betaproteobacteria bacterium]|nr:RsmB/NOP family class I SAM-dependent RNA methyltransferase [Betaproteobacteria bacterium]